MISSSSIARSWVMGRLLTSSAVFYAVAAAVLALEFGDLPGDLHDRPRPAAAERFRRRCDLAPARFSSRLRLISSLSAGAHGGGGNGRRRGGKTPAPRGGVGPLVEHLRKLLDGHLGKDALEGGFLGDW